jgi:hypothetical protein
MSIYTARGMEKTLDTHLGANPSARSHNTHKTHQESILPATGTIGVIPSAYEGASLLRRGKQAAHSRRGQTGSKRVGSPLDLISLNDKR